MNRKPAFKWNLLRTLAAGALLALAPVAQAATSAPGLGSAESYAVLAASAVSLSGDVSITGDLGLSPGLNITGQPQLTGALHAGDPAAAQAQSDLAQAYAEASRRPCQTSLDGIHLDGVTLSPGVKCLASGATLSGELTLDARGDPQAVFIFKVSGDLTAERQARVTLKGVSACNVFWQISGAASLGEGASLAGSLLADGAISLQAGASIEGRALTRGGAITLNGSTVSRPAECAGAAAASTGQAQPTPVATAASAGDSGYTAPTPAVPSGPPATGGAPYIGGLIPAAAAFLLGLGLAIGLRRRRGRPAP